MKIIHRPRQGGKTTELLKLANNHSGYIVVHSRHEATRMFNEAKERGFDIRFPITYDELLSNRMRGSLETNLFIDNVEMFLQSISPRQNVEAVTFSGLIDSKPGPTD